MAKTIAPVPAAAKSLSKASEKAKTDTKSKAAEKTEKAAEKPKTASKAKAQTDEAQAEKPKRPTRVAYFAFRETKGSESGDQQYFAIVQAKDAREARARVKAETKTETAFKIERADKQNYTNREAMFVAKNFESQRVVEKDGEAVGLRVVFKNADKMPKGDENAAYMALLGAAIDMIPDDDNENGNSELALAEHKKVTLRPLSENRVSVTVLLD